MTETQLYTALAEITLRIGATPERGDLFLSRAKIYLALKDEAKALDDLDNAILLDNGLAEAYFLRGKLYFGLNNKEAAYDDLRRAAEIDPMVATSSLSGEFSTDDVSVETRRILRKHI
ncbi:MAG: tetratricopeptide repeat protein [Bacteroidaceae bacterium]